MPFSREGLKKNPYNKCIICERLGEDCDGANLLVQDIQKICEWVVIRQDYLRITNEDLAEAAGVAVITVARIRAAAKSKEQDPDFRFSNLQRVVRALIGENLGTHPCPVIGKEDPVLVQELKEQCRNLSAALERKDREREEAIAKVEQEAERKVSYLLRALKVVSIVAASIVLLMIAALVIDLMRHDVGFFWRG